MDNYNSLGAAFGSALGGYVSSTTTDSTCLYPGSILSFDSTQLQANSYYYQYQPQQYAIGIGGGLSGGLAKVAEASRSILENLRLEISNWCDGVLKV